MAVAHAISDDRVVLPTESHRAAQSPPVLRYYMSGSHKHLPHQKKRDTHTHINLNELQVRVHLRVGVYFKVRAKVRVGDTIKASVQTSFKLRFRVRVSVRSRHHLASS